MSYSSDYSTDGFTEYETEVGVPRLVHGYGYYDQLDHRYIKDTLTEEPLDYFKYYSDEDNLIVSNFSLMKLKTQFLTKLKDKNNLDELIDEFNLCVNSILVDKLSVNYFKKENLDPNLIELAKAKNCIEKLVLNVLYKHAELPVETERKKETIQELFRICSLNTTAYSRVGEIQSLMHRTINEYYTDGAHLLLPSDVMRKTLSIARLNLFIRDLFNKNSDELMALIEKSNIEAQDEYLNPSDRRVSDNKRNIQRWNVRHLKPFTDFIDHYNPIETYSVIKSLFDSSFSELEVCNYKNSTEKGFDYVVNLIELGNDSPNYMLKFLNATSNYYIKTYKIIRETS